MLAAALILAFALAAPAVPTATARPDKPSYNRHTGLFEPPFSELEQAVGRGDRADVARWAARIGPARLAEALRGTDRARIIAALEALILLPGNVRLLDATTPLIAARDLSISERAARAVGQMLDSSEPRRLEDWDIPVDAVARGCRALTDAAVRPQAPLELRLAALDALADAALLCKPAPLQTLLTDATPAVRRAALLAQRPRDDLPVTTVKQGLADADPAVVSATAVVWCRNRLVSGIKPPTAAELARLPAGPSPGSPPFTPPLRELASAETTPVEDAIELLPCLALSSDSADRKALEQLRKARTPQLKTNAAELNSPPGR